MKVYPDLEPIGPITFIGYDKFDPFKDITQTGGFKIPELMQTKTEPARSDDEISKDMEKLAKEHARAVIFQIDDKRFAKLIDEYVSSVSPDRESILKSQIGEILERVKNDMPDMVIDGDMYNNVLIQNGVVENADFYDENGELIMNYNGDKLYQSYTKAEGTRLQEMLNVYNEAYDNAAYERFTKIA